MCTWKGRIRRASLSLVQVVDHIGDADVAVLRLPPPFEPREEFVLEPLFHQGSLDFEADVVDRLRLMAEEAPLIVDVRLERPAVLTPLVDLASVLIGSFGSSDPALARALTEPGSMRGRLPFDIPRSMASVERSLADVPHDLDEVLYPHAHP